MQEMTMESKLNGVVQNACSVAEADTITRLSRRADEGAPTVKRKIQPFVLAQVEIATMGVIPGAFQSSDFDG
jgi:hypothetical protein